MGKIVPPPPNLTNVVAESAVKILIVSSAPLLHVRYPEGEYNVGATSKYCETQLQRALDLLDSAEAFLRLELDTPEDLSLKIQGDSLLYEHLVRRGLREYSIRQTLSSAAHPSWTEAYGKKFAVGTTTGAQTWVPGLQNPFGQTSTPSWQPSREEFVRVQSWDHKTCFDASTFWHRFFSIQLTDLDGKMPIQLS